MTVQRMGSEQVVNTTTAGDQSEPSVASAPSGSFEIAWTDASAGAGASVIRDRAYDATGTPGAEALLARGPVSDASLSFVSSYAGPGGFTANYLVLGAGGAASVRGDETQPFDPPGGGVASQVTQAGGAYTAWTQTVNGAPSVWQETGYGQYSPYSPIAKLDGSGVADHIAAFDPTAAIWRSGSLTAYAVQLASDPAGTSHIAVDGDVSPYAYGNGHFSHVFSAKGDQPGLAVNGDTFLVAWRDPSVGAAGHTISGRLYTIFPGDGNNPTDPANPGEAESANFRIDIGTADDSHPRAAALTNGLYVVTWWSNGGGANGYDIRGQLLNPDGTLRGSAFTVNGTLAGDQTQDSVAALPGGEFVVTWTDTSHTGADTSGSAIRAQVFQSDPSGQVMTGGPGNDTLTALPGGSELIGGAGNDTLIGGAGADSLYGGTGDDVLTGGGGADVLFGGEGHDTFRYLAVSDSTTAAPDTIENFQYWGDTIDLRGVAGAEVQLIPSGGGTTELLFAPDSHGILAGEIIVQGQVTDRDLLVGPQTVIYEPGAVIGSSGNDLIVGGPGVTTLTGGAGADVFRLGPTSSPASSPITITDFQSGVDKLDLTTATAGRVHLYLGSSYVAYTRPTGEVGGVHIAGPDGIVLSDILAPAGTEFLVSLYSIGPTPEVSLFRAGAGNTTFIGGAGEQLIGGDYNDTFTGGTHQILTGGKGADHFVFSALSQSAPTDPRGDPTLGLTRITDFNPGEGDVIDLTGLDADPATPGHQPFQWVTAFDGHPGEATLIYDPLRNETFLLLDSNGDQTSDFTLLLYGHITSHAGILF